MFYIEILILFICGLWVWIWRHTAEMGPSAWAADPSPHRHHTRAHDWLWKGLCWQQPKALTGSMNANGDPEFS